MLQSGLIAAALCATAASSAHAQLVVTTPERLPNTTVFIGTVTLTSNCFTDAYVAHVHFTGIGSYKPIQMEAIYVVAKSYSGATGNRGVPTIDASFSNYIVFSPQISGQPSAYTSVKELDFRQAEESVTSRVGTPSGYIKSIGSSIYQVSMTVNASGCTDYYNGDVVQTNPPGM